MRLVYFLFAVSKERKPQNHYIIVPAPLGIGPIMSNVIFL